MSVLTLEEILNDLNNDKSIDDLILILKKLHECLLQETTDIELIFELLFLKETNQSKTISLLNLLSKWLGKGRTYITVRIELLRLLSEYMKRILYHHISIDFLYLSNIIDSMAYVIRIDNYNHSKTLSFDIFLISFKICKYNNYLLQLDYIKYINLFKNEIFI